MSPSTAMRCNTTCTVDTLYTTLPALPALPDGGVTTLPALPALPDGGVTTLPALPALPTLPDGGVTTAERLEAELEGVANGEREWWCGYGSTVVLVGVTVARLRAQPPSINASN